jgi:phosphatidylserine/phosphatidylglycerophosphate/cardiolipin synthase-like enzyme
MMTETHLVFDHEIYDQVIEKAVPATKRFLWIGTSDLKDLYVGKQGRIVPFLEILSYLIYRNVEVRLIHAKEPGEAFQRDFDCYPSLIHGMERILCPRVHFKCVVSDGTFAYTGSANLTGAGMGAKSKGKRNFETGIVTTDPKLIEGVMEQFDSVWMGKRCVGCERKKYCADYKDLE